MVAQIAVETMIRAKKHGKPITRQTIYEELMAMNGKGAYDPHSTVGPVTYSKTDKEGVDTLQTLRGQGRGVQSGRHPLHPRVLQETVP